MEHNALSFHLPVLDVHFVATQHYGNVLTHTHQVTMPVRNILISHSRGHVKHDDRTLSWRWEEKDKVAHYDMHPLVFR